MNVRILAVALAAAGFASSAFATNGYFSHGYGMKAKGMAGAATASASDTFGGANNPASMVWVGNRMDLGVDLFSPNREMSRAANPAPSGPTDLPPVAFSSDSQDNYFLIPEFGFNRMLQPNLAVGVTVYGNGGMNTDYNEKYPFPGSPNPLFGMGDLGVDLMQLIVAPTLSYKLNDQHSIGISPLFALQRFSATGLQAFDPFMTGLVTNNGNEYSTGWGVRVGWLGKISEQVTVGAAYASKMSMSELDEYAGLFAEQGDFDIPENWNIGIAIQATPQVKVALDYQSINYSGIKSINNPSTNYYACVGGDMSQCLGADNGPGFGWDDVGVWKLGVEYAYQKNLILRAGWNHGDNPISKRDVTFNILAPGIVQDHLTLGFTYTTASGSELTMSYMHAFENDVTAGSLLNPTVPETIKMHQDSIGIAYSIKM